MEKLVMSYSIFPEDDATVREDVTRILASGSALWKRLRSARLYLTGGTGFFGSWLLRTLFAANDAFSLNLSITVLSRDPERFGATHPRLASREELRLLRGNVEDFQPPDEAFDYIIHAATDADAETNRRFPRSVLSANALGTHNTLEMARRHRASGYLFVSSCAVYGSPPLKRIPETCLWGPNPADPRAVYGEAKRVGEMLCSLAANEGVPARIARVFSVVGPGIPLDRHFAVGNFIRDAIAGGPIVLSGDGTPIRAYMYIGDLVTWLLTVLIDGEPGRPYNVGTEEGASLLKVAGIAAGLTGLPKSSVEVARQPAQNTYINALVPDTRRATAELSLQIKTRLDESLARTIQFYRHTGYVPDSRDS